MLELALFLKYIVFTHDSMAPVLIAYTLSIFWYNNRVDTFSGVEGLSKPVHRQELGVARVTSVKASTFPFSTEKINGKSRKLVINNLDVGFAQIAALGNEGNKLILGSARI